MFAVSCTKPVFGIVIYHPQKTNSNFLFEFSDFITDVVVKYDKVILASDFNFHIVFGGNLKIKIEHRTCLLCV